MLDQHPANHLLRFFLEVVALVVMGQWGWERGEGALRYMYAIGLPIVMAVLWGVFAVPGDPSRSGKAPVPVPGRVRLALEFVFFSLAVWVMLATGRAVMAGAIAFALLLHYFWSARRVAWLLRN